LKKIFYSPGEPSGIGVDLIIEICKSDYWKDSKHPIVCLGDPNLFLSRAKLLNKKIKITLLENHKDTKPNKKGLLQIIQVAKCKTYSAGKLNPSNASYVIEHLNYGINQCLLDKNNALVTGPISKKNIIDSGVNFSGHTEWIQKITKSKDVLMLLASEQIKVALITTHVPLKKVSKLITKETIIDKATILNDGLKSKLKIKKPNIVMLGLNPHAGEGGKVGTEELEILEPAAKYLRKIGINISDPISADTAFTPTMLNKTDAYLAMYHDQGLPVMKALSFGNGINITLGVPIIRTSVDHGIALDIAGSGKADTSSLENALHAASSIV